mgnify:CR=1 FL=1
MILHNVSSVTIKNIYMSSKNEAYGSDRLGSAYMKPNGDLRFTVSPGVNKLKVINEDGSSCEWERIDILGGVEKKMDFKNEENVFATCKLRLSYLP